MIMLKTKERLETAEEIEQARQEMGDWYDSLSEGQKEWLGRRIQDAKKGELSDWDVNEILEKIEVV